MRACLVVWLMFLMVMQVSMYSSVVAVSLSGVLALSTMLVFLKFGYGKSFRDLFAGALFSYFNLGMILFFMVVAFVYHYLTGLVSATSESKMTGMMWSASRFLAVFHVWFGLMMIMYLLSETWVIFFSNRPLAKWHILNTSAIVLAVVVGFVGEYLDLMVQAWLAAIVVYVVVFLISVGGLRFDSGRISHRSVGSGR